jgi:hypothetical protein
MKIVKKWRFVNRRRVGERSTVAAVARAKRKVLKESARNAKGMRLRVFLSTKEKNARTTKRGAAKSF